MATPSFAAGAYASIQGMGAGSLMRKPAGQAGGAGGLGDFSAMVGKALESTADASRKADLQTASVASGRTGIVVFLKAGGPLMVVALIVGLAVSLVQALTQIQEQTLVYVPKILATFGALLLFLPFMGDALAGYMGRVAVRIATGE